MRTEEVGLARSKLWMHMTQTCKSHSWIVIVVATAVLQPAKPPVLSPIGQFDVRLKAINSTTRVAAGWSCRMMHAHRSSEHARSRFDAISLSMLATRGESCASDRDLPPSHRVVLQLQREASAFCDGGEWVLPFSSAVQTCPWRDCA
jgi:hypothetical protein